MPLVPFVPFQSPDAVHDVAPVDDQASVAAPPEATAVGLAVNVTVGPPVVCPDTVTTTSFDTIPPGPIQASLKVRDDVMFAIVSVPRIGL